MERADCIQSLTFNEQYQFGFESLCALDGKRWEFYYTTLMTQVNLSK